MEFVNSIIAFFTPYFGEYAQYAPIVIGALLAILAYAIKPRVIKKMGAEAKEQQRDKNKWKGKRKILKSQIMKKERKKRIQNKNNKTINN